MLVLSIIFAILSIVLAYFTWNLMRKVEQYEDIAQYQQNYIENISTIIGESSKRLQEVDGRGTFESDDEVGFFFKTLKEVQSILDEFNLNVTDGQKEEQE
jgi:anaerobic ribonucleoside-triphosphate reductase